MGAHVPPPAPRQPLRSSFDSQAPRNRLRCERALRYLLEVGGEAQPGGLRRFSHPEPSRPLRPLLFPRLGGEAGVLANFETCFLSHFPPRASKVPGRPGEWQTRRHLSLLPGASGRLEGPPPPLPVSNYSQGTRHLAPSPET